MRHGILPRYIQLTMFIAIAAGKLAGMAKKTWRDDTPAKLKLSSVQALRAEMNSAFDHLEAILATPGYETISAIESDNADRAQAAFARHGNLAMLGTCLMEEAAELAEPLLKVTCGEMTFAKAKPLIDGESADLRVYLHVTSEHAGVCAETTTARKWGEVRERFPEEAFSIAPGQPVQDMKVAIQGLVKKNRKAA
jgi:hypothetical protein